MHPVKKHSPSLIKGILLSQFAALGGSIFFILYQKGCDGIEPIIGAYTVFVFAFLFNIYPSKKHFFSIDKSILTKKYIIMIALVCLSALVGNVSAAYALQFFPPSSVHLIQRSETIFAILLGIFFLKEGDIKILLVSMILFCCGLYFLYIHENEASHNNVNFTPFIMGLLSAISFAVMQASTRVLLDKIDALLINSVRLFLLVVLMSILHPTIIVKSLAIPADNLLYLAIAAFVGPFLARVAYMNAAGALGVARAALLASSSPIMTLILQTIIIGLSVTFYQLFGSIILLIAVSFPILWHYWGAKQKAN